MRPSIRSMAAIALAAALASPAGATVIGGYGAFTEVRICTNQQIGCPGPGH